MTTTQVEGRVVPITRGKHTIIDEDIADDILRDFRLYAFHNTKSGKWYVLASPKVIGRRRGRPKQGAPKQPKAPKRQPMFYLHRILTGAEGKQVVDHVNGNSLDNRTENLRIVTHAQNLMNVKTNSKTNTSGYRGVAKHGRGWSAMHAGQHLGIFRTAREAAIAWDKAARAKYEHAFQNFPNSQQLPDPPRSRRPENRTGFIGVRQKGNSYEARHGHKSLGYYDTAELAAKAYDIAARLAPPRKGTRFNFPEEK